MDHVVRRKLTKREYKTEHQYQKKITMGNVVETGKILKKIWIPQVSPSFIISNFFTHLTWFFIVVLSGHYTLNTTQHVSTRTVWK